MLRLSDRIRANDPTLDVVDLGGFWLCESDLARLCSALAINTVVKKVSLEWVVITSGFYNLAEMIAKNRGIEELDIRSCIIDSSDFETLAIAIASKNTTLKRLDVRGNSLDDEETVCRACEILATGRAIETVDIGPCDFADRLKSIRAVRCEEFKQAAFAIAHGFYDNKSYVYRLNPHAVSSILSHIKPRPFEICAQ